MRRSGGFGLDRVRVMDRDIEELHLVKDVGGGGVGKKTPFLDRSKVRILLCDNDVKSSKEVVELLCKCSYQVTSVRTPRQVIDALNAEGRDIDLILAEVDLPIAKGLKMLKYIMRDKELQRIPIIMMSAKDEVSVVVKCLKRGAADYLVKPLRTNELLNLWTHMWRRREMLGLAEKNILNYDFDIVASDPSDPNTNSTTLFSDDTDDKSRRSTIQELPTSNLREHEPNAATFVEPPLKDSFERHLDAPGPSDWQTGKFSSFLKKSELKIGVSSAFFTYVKSSMSTISQKVDSVRENAAVLGPSCRGQNQLVTNIQIQETRTSQGNYCRDGFAGSSTVYDTSDTGRPCITPTPLENTDGGNSKEEQPPMVLLHPRNDTQLDVSGGQALAPYPYYLPAMMNQFMIPSQPQLYQGSSHDLVKSSTSSLLPQYGPHPHHTHVPGMSSFPYYPVNLCMQPGQMPTTHMWPSIGNSASNEVKPSRHERREAALIKFRQKRKDRCFDKKIRYINRKKLAERRPRLRGQFVRQVNGIDVVLNGRPAGFDDFDEDGEEDVDEDGLGFRDSSLDGDASGY